MSLPPELHPQHVRHAAEVIPPFGRSSPKVLADGLAGLAAGGLRTVPLVPAAPRVGLVQLLAVMALASSLAGHGRLQSQSPHGAPTPPIHEENATRRNPTAHRRRPRKKTIMQFREENPAEENPIFKPAGLPHFQIGDDTLPPRHCRPCPQWPLLVEPRPQYMSPLSLAWQRKAFAYEVNERRNRQSAPSVTPGNAKLSRTN